MQFELVSHEPSLLNDVGVAIANYNNFVSKTILPLTTMAAEILFAVVSK